MSSTTVIRVMVVDDHPVTIRGLRQVLEDCGGFEVVAEAGDGAEAVATAQQLRPDVVVMDAIMPKMDGVEACREICDLLPDTKVVMLTASTADDAAIEASAAGAAGFVHKYASGDELTDAIQQVAAGRLAIPETAVRRAFELIRTGAAMAPGPDVLTERETEVLTRFAQGGTYAQIAQQLDITKAAVRNAVYRIQDKLHVDSKQQMVVWAVRNGLLDTPRR